MISYADQLRMCSDSFQVMMETLQRQGVPYYGDPAYKAARICIQNFVPDVVLMGGGEGSG